MILLKAFVLLIILLLCGIVYVAYVLLKSYDVVKKTPREDMFLCQKGHGPLPKKSLINFMGEDYCPICFHERLKVAEKGELLK